MRTNLLTIALFGLLIQIPVFAQNKTTVNATNSEISDNLDLRAVASIFGDSRDLADFERRLNDPSNKISNLDLNYDRQVDYLRVIEVVENSTHLIILQAVLERDVFQDVATIEVERGRNNQIQIQVVGDVFMYGPNYIYEPVYVNRPVIFNHFWVNNYNPYYSPYYFNFYPSYYFAWTPFPVYRYRRNVNIHINQYNFYNYSNSRRSTHAVALYQSRRSNGFERQYPNQSFASRNNVSNRYELDNSRNNGRRVSETRSRNYNTASNGTSRGVSNTAQTRTSSTTNTRQSTANTANTRNYNANTSTRGGATANSVPTRTTTQKATSSPTTTTRTTPSRNITQQMPSRQVEATRSPRVEQTRTTTRNSSQVNTRPRTNSQVKSAPRSSGSSQARSAGSSSSSSRNTQATSRTRTNGRN